MTETTILRRLPKFNQIKIMLTNVNIFFKLGKALSTLHQKYVAPVNFLCVLIVDELVNEATEETELSRKAEIHMPLE